MLLFDTVEEQRSLGFILLIILSLNADSWFLEIRISFGVSEIVS